MRSIIAISIATLFLTGCATNTDYKMYAETQQKIAQAHAVAQTARYNALAEIAKSGDSAAKVAAVLSIQMGNMNGSSQQPQQNIAAPEDLNQKMLRWAGVLLPTVTQGLGIAAQLHAANVQKQIAVTQSNNAAATAQNTNNTFAAMSTNMATSNTNIAQAGFNAVGAAGTALSTVATAGLTATQNTATAGLTATQNTATAGITGVNNAATAGFNSATTLGTAGITGVSNTASAGITGMNTAVANGNALTNNVATGYTSSLQAAIAKLTGTTTTTTTSTTNTTNTTTTNNVCPVGQILTNGQCQ
jgi:hypothetical protein